MYQRKVSDGMRITVTNVLFLHHSHIEPATNNTLIFGKFQNMAQIPSKVYLKCLKLKQRQAIILSSKSKK